MCEFLRHFNIFRENEISKSLFEKNFQMPNQTKVPTSRSEVFKSDKLSMIEKRVMMKFVQSCTKDDNFSELIDNEAKNNNISFKDFILSKKFPASINNFLINAVAMSPTNTSYTAVEVEYLFIFEK